MQFNIYIYNRIEYLEGKWKIIDGDGNKVSTNGTWVYANEPVKIFEGMLFKAGQLLFEVKYKADKT